MAAESVMWALERNWEMVDAALEGLDEATMAMRPNDESNSIAWIFWHMNRVVDTFILHRLQSKPELWVSEGWSEKLGMRDNPDDRGLGHSAEQIEAWQAPSQSAQLGYYEAVKAAARQYISSLTPADLDKAVVFPRSAQRQDHTVASGLGQPVWDNVAHGGQIAYLRGFFKGMGWHR